MTTLTPLRNIHLSGGLFTENLLLKIRDKKDKIPEVQWTTFGEKWQEEKKRYYEVWDWAKRLFGEIANKLETWTIEDRFEKWIKPLLQKLGHESELKPSIDLTTLSEEEQDNILNRIQVSHQLKNHAKIGLHICEDENFDERNDANYQKKSQHDHFQRYILLNEGVRWGLLSNGKHIRLLGEYSNIYAKGYIQFNLDSIFINKDESEFWVFYALIHRSRFNETYGLNPDDWIDKLKKKWKDLSKKLSSEDANINSNIISEEILKIYYKNLNEFIDKAINKGVKAIKLSDSEIFMLNIKDTGLDLSVIGRDFYLKELDSVISDINENLSMIQRLQKRSQEEGTEAGKKLRENIKKALELMGKGLIESSKTFSVDILKGLVEIKEFYQELLRITYRIIFVLYAEAKELLPGVATIYYNDLGLTYLRKKAQQPIRDDQNKDLWYRLLLLFRYLDIGECSLGINAFSGELFNPERIRLILNKNNNLSLPNSVLLKIIRELTIVDLGIGLQAINYSEIGEEEIGGIYEALLDFQPRYVKKDTPTYHFILEEIDTERKGTGTYYTSKGLIDILLKTALKPVVESKIAGLDLKDDKLKAILDLKICDPACGGGSFLLASIDYLGKIHAQIESDQEFPEDKVLRNSRRKILQHCIYGVDLFPMALELAKVSLWLKASVGNKPLTFLDNHLKVGNSLIGLGKNQEINKIPSKAFNLIKGNVKTGIPNEKKKNIEEAKKKIKTFSIKKGSIEGKTSIQKTLFPYEDSGNYSNIALDIFTMEENDITALKEKRKCYLKLKESKSWINLTLQANLFTSSFFWGFGEDYNKDIPTDTILIKAKRGVIKNDNGIIQGVNRLSNEFKFFNWYLEFPEVFQRENPGFDCILMNPPWEVIQPKDMEFFAGKSKEVINTRKQAERQKNIKLLSKTNPKLHQEYIKYYYSIKKKVNYFKNNELYKLSSKGAINEYALFIDKSRSLINQSGRISCIVLSSILTTKDLSLFFQEFIKTNMLNSIFLFENERNIFPGVAHNMQFCLLSLESPKNIKHPILMASSIWEISTLNKAIENYENNIEVDDINQNIREGGSILELNNLDFTFFNPNTKNAPIFRRRADFEIVKKAYKKTCVLIQREDEKVKNPWTIEIKRMLVSTDDSDFLHTKEQLKALKAKPLEKNYSGGIWKINGQIYVPVYSGASIWLYDHRYNEIIPKADKSKKLKVNYKKVTDMQKIDRNYSHIPLYWVEKAYATKKYPKNWSYNWFISYRRIASPSLKRTFTISIIPKYSALNSLNIITFKIFRKEIICFLANVSSIPFDFILRRKLAGSNIPTYLFEQLPVFPPEFYSEELFDVIKTKAIELIYTSWDLSDFTMDFNISEEKTPFKWDSDRRHIIMTELDAIFAILYGYTKRELDYILNTFDVLRDSELKEFGEFKTKRLILEAYDKFNSDPVLGPLFRLEGVDLEKLKSE